MKSIKEHRWCWQPYWSNHVFGIVGHSTLFRKTSSLKSIKADETKRNIVKERMTLQPDLCSFVWSLSFNIWVPHNSRGNQTHHYNVAEVCRRTWEKNRSYSRTQLMLNAPNHKINIGWWTEILLCFFFFFLSSFPGDIDLIGEPALGDTEVTRGRKKKQTNRWATFVPFFTAELGRWRSEDTLLRNCKKPWFCFKCSKLGTVSKSHCLSENRITKKKTEQHFGNMYQTTLQFFKSNQNSHLFT